MTTTTAQRSVFDAEAFAALERAVGHGRALADALTGASNALTMANRDVERRELERITELLRLAGARLAALERRLVEPQEEP